MKTRFTVEDVLAIENGEDAASYYESLQAAIDSGMAWKLQGSYGRAAMAAIEEGHCMLGEVGHRDTYGNYVPSRYEVQAGTKGSAEYCEGQTYDDGDVVRHANGLSHDVDTYCDDCDAP